jgi:hypothetical protein
MKYIPVVKINTYTTGKFNNGSTVCTPDRFAMQARCSRLIRILKANVKGVK